MNYQYKYLKYKNKYYNLLKAGSHQFKRSSTAPSAITFELDDDDDFKEAIENDKKRTLNERPDGDLYQLDSELGPTTYRVIDSPYGRPTDSFQPTPQQLDTLASQHQVTREELLRPYMKTHTPQVLPPKLKKYRSAPSTLNYEEERAF